MINESILVPLMWLLIAIVSGAVATWLAAIVISCFPKKENEGEVVVALRELVSKFILWVKEGISWKLLVAVGGTIAVFFLPDLEPLWKALATILGVTVYTASKTLQNKTVIETKAALAIENGNIGGLPRPLNEPIAIQPFVSAQPVAEDQSEVPFPFVEFHNKVLENLNNRYKPKERNAATVMYMARDLGNITLAPSNTALRQYWNYMVELSREANIFANQVMAQIGACAPKWTDIYGILGEVSAVNRYANIVYRYLEAGYPWWEKIDKNRQTYWFIGQALEELDSQGQFQQQEFEEGTYIPKEKK